MAVEWNNPFAAGPYLELLDASAGDSDASVAGALAALDALIWRSTKGLAPGVDHAVAHRSREGLVQTAGHLRRAWRTTKSPLVRGSIARALHDLALRVGDPKAAKKWSQRAGCPTTATLIGPLGHPPLSSLGDAPRISSDALPLSFDGVPPFASKVVPEVVFPDGCSINVSEVSPLKGLRAVVVDIHNDAPQKLYFAVESRSAAKAFIAGKPLLEREYAAGGEPVMRLGEAFVDAGVARLVVHVAYNQDGYRVGIRVWDQEGKPLKIGAAAVGAEAKAVAIDAKERRLDGVESPLLAAAGMLALGDARGAAQRLEAAKSKSLETQVLRLRALGAARMVPRSQLLLQLEGTAETALEQCPGCWELNVIAARVARDRQGFGAGAHVALEKLGWGDELGPMELVYAATVASEAGMSDIARRAFDALAAAAPHSMMVADLDWRLHRRFGDDRVRASCDGGTSRATTRCLQAHASRSDLRGVYRELGRLRELRGSPAILRDVEMRQLLAHGDSQSAMRIYKALPPARRSLALLGAAEADEARALFAQDMLQASDAPYFFEPLARVLGHVEDPSERLTEQGAELVKRDREKAFLPGAGTAVLRRVERYELEPTGLLRWSIYDLRRVSGTLDVASGTWTGTPIVTARVASRMLRRRIYKQDGRVLDPDPTPRARQSSTELSQLQTGDYVEALIVGWALPGDAGQLVVDTPDMLRPRQSVRAGELHFSRPAPLPLKLWSHPILGSGAEKSEAGRVVTTWKLDNQAPRRLEEGVPPLEGRVAISFGTDSWERIASAVADQQRALDDEDPYVVRWLDENLGNGWRDKPARTKLDAIVAAAGKAIVRGDPSLLEALGATLGGGSQHITARHILEKGAGSRTWVIHRALREAGIASEIAVSERRPFSAAPGFPPHPSRFEHPLVRATIDGTKVWVDADIQGPPLPPGRISPELRGRKALLANGDIVTVDADTSTDVDDIQVQLAVDNNGNASGSYQVKLYGRPAQRLVDVLERAVGSHRQELLRNVVLGWLPWADVAKTELRSAGGFDLWVNAKINVIGFARPESRARRSFSLPGLAPIHAVYPRPRASTLSARFASQADRTTALAINQPLLYRFTRNIDLPAGAKVESLPAEFKIDTPNLTASRKTSLQGGRIVDRFDLNVPVGTVPPATYAAFATNVRKTDDAFMHAIRIELGP